MTETAQPETFFDPHQRATVEAAMARIIPTDQTPGAREAGAVDFVDRYLSGIGYIYALPDGSGFERLEGRRADAWQQRVDVARSKYAAGIVELDRLCRERHDAHFVELAEEQQDQMLRVIERAGSPEAERAWRDTPAIAYGGPGCAGTDDDGVDPFGLAVRRHGCPRGVGGCGWRRSSRGWSSGRCGPRRDPRAPGSRSPASPPAPGCRRRSGRPGSPAWCG